MAIEHTFLGKDGVQQTKLLTPMRAIRKKCLECSNYSSTEVSRCVIKNCALYPFRKGKRPQSGT